MRTDEQIQRDLEEAYSALVAEKERRDEIARLPENAMPCVDCRYFGGYKWTYTKEGMLCTCPLIAGFNGISYAYDDKGRFLNHTAKKLCGPEKALWRPKLKLWQKLANKIFDAGY